MNNDREDQLASLRDKAQRCRRLADGISDSAAREQLDVFAQELEQQAARLYANIRATETHSAIGKQIVAELKNTSRQAKDAARHARRHRHRPKHDHC